MEDLTARPDDRGQLLIVAAVGLAILLTLLALSLNTAVFGEIHVAQTDGSLEEERAAIQYEHGVERGVGGLLVRLNENNDDYEALQSELEEGVESWAGLSRSEYARDGVATSVSVASVSYETRIVQNESGDFTDQSGTAEWIVAEDVSDIHGFEANVSDEELVETSDCAGGEECFTLEVEGESGDPWRLFVYDNGGVTLKVDPPSEDTDNCSTSGTSARINVTGGTFGSGEEECEFTTFLEDEEVEAPYTLTYTNADNVSGTYELTVDGKIVEGTIDDDERYGTDGAPRIEAEIDAAAVAVRYRSADLTYETEIRVTPGEIDG